MTPTERKSIMVEYMKAKIAEEDWHAVSDVANDLRELEVELRYNNASRVVYMTKEEADRLTSDTRTGIDAFGLPVITYEGAKK